MRLTKSKTYKVNLGNYEHLEVGGHVTVADTDIYEDGGEGMDPADKFADLLKAADEYLDQLLEPELRAAANVSAAPDSVLFDPAPRRERATRRRSKD